MPLAYPIAAFPEKIRNGFEATLHNALAKMGQQVRDNLNENPQKKQGRGQSNLFRTEDTSQSFTEISLKEFSSKDFS